MKRTLSVVAAVIFVMMSAFIVWAGGFELKGNAGSYYVDVKLDHNPPARGHNSIDIIVTDEASRPVTDAQVEIEYLMPSLGGRPPMMDYSTTAELTGNKYHGTLNLTMAGEWRVLVKIVRAGKGEIVGFTFVVP